MQICHFINLHHEGRLQTEYMFFVVEPLLLEVSSWDWYPIMLLMGIFKRSLYCCLDKKKKEGETEVYISYTRSLGVIKDFKNATGIFKYATILNNVFIRSEGSVPPECG